MDAIQLIDPHSRNNPDEKLIKRDSEHYFLDLAAFTEQILEYLDKHEHHWRPNVSRFSQNFVKDGLRGRPITRDIDWGIRVPLEGWEDKRLYVWFDAVMGYFTASIEWAKNIGQPDAWKQWWYNRDAKIYNFIGKDNIPFHTIIWQAELLGINGIYNEDDPTYGDIPLQLPYDVPANEFMNIEGEQFSTSRNWAVWLPDLLERYQADALRFYVARTFPERQDSDFSWEGFLARVNNELLAAWGNLVNRVCGFAYKRFDGAVPAYDQLTPADEAIIAATEAGFDKVGALLEAVRLKDALEETLGPGARGQRLAERARTLEDAQARPGRCRPLGLRGAALHRQLEGAVRALCPLQLAAGARDAGLRGAALRRAARSRITARRRAITWRWCMTGARRSGRGRRAGCGRGSGCARRVRCL